MPYHPQTEVLEGPERIHISRNCKDGKITQNYFNDIPSQTLFNLFTRGFKLSGNKPCLGTRVSPTGPYEWLTYREVKDMAESMGSAFMALGHTVREEEKIGIYASNRYEWDVTEIANYSYSLVTVPLYDTLGVEAISYIMSITEMKTVVCDDESKVKKILSCKSDIPHLSLVITMNTIPDDLIVQLKEADIKHMTFHALIEFGKTKLQPPQPPTQDDYLALILFTSGTTGRPKGVMLTNKNIATDVGAVYEHFSPFFEVTNDDCVISYLPQAHGFNQVATLVMLTYGGRVGYLSGSVLNLMNDLKELKPTMLPIVPRLLNRIYDSVWQKTSKNSVKKFLLKKAYETKKLQMEKGGIVRNDLADMLVFKKIHKLLGGRVRAMLTGSAPVSSEVLTFIRAAVGCYVLEGYGQTETTAGSTVSIPGDFTAGHVGVPLTCCEIKLVDIPEMNYHASQNQGEVCLRGPHCFVGYWKDEENTRETIDEDGWVHSGDVGIWTEQGMLKIVDRKKNIFKLAQGEYIAPEKIENIYVQTPIVQQVFVHGDSLEICCVAVVVPDQQVLRDVAVDMGIEETSWQSLCSNPQIKQYILKEMQAKANENKLNKLEQVKAIYVWSEQFSMDNDLLTPTMKSKRPQLRAKFGSELKNLYAELADAFNQQAK